MSLLKNSMLKDIAWDDFAAKSARERAPFFLNGDRQYHVIYSQQFERPFLDRICELATRTRRIAKTRGGMMFLQELLAEKSAMLYFAQPSSRTFLSFLAACKILGIKAGEVRDSTTSSEMKGESQEDTVRTFSSYFDMIIMRHPQGGFADRIAWMLSRSDRPVPVINAGSGKDQHPTQALLDIYTLQRSFEERGGIEGKMIAFVGDLARGRTVRSLAYLLTSYPGVHMIFVSPPSLQIGQDILEHLDQAGASYEIRDNLIPVLPDVDAVYMTRIQDEWDAGDESGSIDIASYAITPERLDCMKKDSIIMHPLPRRSEIAPEVDSDPRAKYWRQVRNGMWARAALMLHVFDRDAEVDRYYSDLVS
jgi:aspartate carbamoyltransferase catalytic subunit